MKHDGTHDHSCRNRVAGCKGVYTCSDDYLERNHDPDGVYCSVDPMSEGECEACYRASRQDQCEDCGEPAVGVVEDADDASGYRGDVALCAACLVKRTAA